MSIFKFWFISGKNPWIPFKKGIKKSRKILYYSIDKSNTKAIFCDFFEEIIVIFVIDFFEASKIPLFWFQWSLFFENFFGRLSFSMKPKVFCLISYPICWITSRKREKKSFDFEIFFWIGIEKKNFNHKRKTFFPFFQKLLNYIIF